MIVQNKTSGEEFTVVADTTMKAAKEILAKGLAAAHEMAEIPRFKLQDSLFSIAREIRGHASDLSRTISIESGKPIRFSRAETERAAKAFEIAAEEIDHLTGKTFQPDTEHTGQHRFAYYSKVPVGLIFSMMPFYDPLISSSLKTAAGLASGNAIINGPTSLAPVSAMKLAEITELSGLPENAVQTAITTNGDTVANFFLESPAIKMVTFSGNREDAEILARKSATKKLQLGMGNNMPVIVWDDADLDSTVEMLAATAFENQGQSQVHPQRILVREQAHEYFRNRLIELTSKLKIGDPLDEATDIGPMISEEEALRIENLVAEAARDGAELLSGGRRDGTFYYPTIMDNVPKDARVWSEEISGPVVCLKSVKSFEEAIEEANDFDYGLQAGIYTADLNLALTAIDKLNYGTVIVNDSPSFISDRLPKSGLRRSGIGLQGIRYLMEEMSEIKLAIIKR